MIDRLNAGDSSARPRFVSISMPPLFDIIRATSTQKQLARQRAFHTLRDHPNDAVAHLRRRLARHHLPADERRVLRLALWYVERV
jgi:hypothetical protein